MKRHAPAAGRNREPIAAVLTEELPTAGLVLEVASGTGEHAVHFARTFPDLDWQPSDPDPDSRDSIAAWCEEAGLANLLPPLELDAAAAVWPLARADAVVCINMVHISPTAATDGLVAGAARLLEPGAPLIVYGPYFDSAVETAPSNAAFDADLRARNPEWGLRSVEWLDGLAEQAGFRRSRRVAMPANNLTLVYRRALK
jgi:SAM-dependent methyltransferase